MAAPIAGVSPRLARRPGIGGIPHRTASRWPGKLAIFSGNTRLTVAEAQAAAPRTAPGMFTAEKR